MSISPYRDVTTPDSGLYETCARHTSRRVARSLQTGYFCDACAKRLVVEVFNDRAPVYHGETLKGFCGLCNLNREVTMRQWFVCPGCWGVVIAYQKSIAASAALAKWWSKSIEPQFAGLTLIETEPVRLTPYVRNPVTKLQSASELSILDFLVSNTSKAPAATLFHIEQKTGPGSIDEMSEFQLDVNDFNDIAGATNKTGRPSYIIHVQATYDYLMPTRRTIIKGMWWTDIFTLKENEKRISNRRDEDERAIYYKPAAFKPIETFCRRAGS